MQLNDTVNLNGIKQDIYFLGHISANTFSSSDLNRIINKYYRILQSDIRAVNEDFFADIATADLVLNTGGTYPNEYPLPDDYEKIKQIQVAFKPANPSSPLRTEYQELQIVPPSYVSDPTTAITEPIAVLMDNSFFVYPLPDSTFTLPVTGGVRVVYIYLGADLSADADKPNIFTDYHDVITWGALIDIAIRLGNNQLLSDAMGMFAKRRAEMKSYASGRADLSGAYAVGEDTGGWSFPFGKQSMS